MTTRKKIAIVLFIIQFLLIVARASMNTAPATGIVFFIPAIIGIGLLFGKNENEEVETYEEYEEIETYEENETKVSKYRKIAIALFIFQALGLIGSLLTGDYYKMGVLEMIGFFIPTLIGAIIWDEEEGWSD